MTDDRDDSVIELPRQRYVAPDEYEWGDIPGVPDDVMRCMPPCGMIHEYVWWASQCTYANPVWHIASILPALAFEFGQMGYVFPGRRDQVALQCFLIGKSTSAKSSCLRMAKSFHEEHRKRAALRAAEERRYSAPPTGRRLIFKAPAEAADTPWLEAEGTVAGLLETLYDRFDHTRGVTPAILFHEEVDGLLNLRDPTMMRTLMQLFDARPAVERQLAKYRAAKKEGHTPPAIIEKPAVGGVFCSTINAMQRAMTTAHFEGGLVSRALWFVATPTLERFEEIEDDDVRNAQRETALGRWAQYGPHLSGLRAQGDSSLAPMSDEVKGLLASCITKRFLKAWTTDDDALAAQLQRARMLARVISSVYALSQGQLEVTPEDMAAAIHLIEWSLKSVELLSGLTDDQEHWRRRRKALDVLQSGGVAGVDKSRLYPALKLSKGELDMLLASLIDEGVIVEARSKSTRGRPKMVYKLASLLSAAAEVGKVIELHPDGDAE